MVEKRLENIVVAENDEQLKSAVVNYDAYISFKTHGIISNNSKFIKEFEREINDMFKRITR